MAQKSKKGWAARQKLLASRPQHYTCSVPRAAYVLLQLCGYRAGKAKKVADLFASRTRRLRCVVNALECGFTIFQACLRRAAFTFSGLLSKCRSLSMSAYKRRSACARLSWVLNPAIPEQASATYKSCTRAEIERSPVYCNTGRPQQLHQSTKKKKYSRRIADDCQHDLTLQYQHV